MRVELTSYSLCFRSRVSHQPSYVISSHYSLYLGSIAVAFDKDTVSLAVAKRILVSGKPKELI